MSKDFKIKNGLEVTTNITASGNISASGTITAATLDAAAVSDALAAVIVAEIDNDEISGDKINGGTIGSTTITALAGALSLGDNNITNVGDIDVDSISIADAAVGLNIDFGGGNTTKNLITLKDNLADALNITEGSNSYIKFITTNSSEQIVVAQNSTFNGTTIADLGTVTTATSITATDLIGTNVDGILGADTARAITGTTIDATTDFTIDGLVITADTITNDAALTVASSETRFGGNISASGDLHIKGNITSSGAINTLSHITASGNISSSGTLIANAITLPDDAISGDLVSGGTIGTTTITALAGNISVGDNNITNVGEISVDKIIADGDAGVTILLGANGYQFNLGENDKNFKYFDAEETELIFGDAGLSRVGIYDTSPVSTLDVGGDLNVQSHITASGNISSSGTILASAYKIDEFNAITTSGTEIQFGYANNWSSLLYGRQDTDNHRFVGHITASGNISASGDILTSGNVTTLGNISGSLTSTGSFGRVEAAGVVSAVTNVFVGDNLSLTSDSSVINMGAGNDFTITHDGTTGATLAGTPISINSTGDLTLDSSTDIVIDAAGGNIEFKDAGTTQLLIDMDTTGGEIRIETEVDGDDLAFYQYDGTEVLRLDDDGDVKVFDDLRLTSDSSVFAMGAGNDFTITHDGTTGATLAATPISIDSTGELHLNSTTGDIKFQDGGTDQLGLDMDGTGGEIIAKLLVDADDLVFQQYDGTEALRIGDDATISATKNKFAVTGNTDGTHQGDVVFLGGTTSMTIGKIYHYKSDGTWELANADAVATSDGLLGVALGAASDTNGMLLRGMVTLDHDPGAVGNVLFVSGSGGNVSATAPALNDNIVRVAGYCLNASNGQIWFNPDNTFVEVTA